ncbi:MAG: hypothetical protein AB1753_04315 [Thermoproteota archaeon]
MMTTTAKWALAGVAAGAASALYLFYNYHHPLLLHGAVHAAIFASGLLLLAAFFINGKKLLDAKRAGAYVAGALPVHLAIHALLIKDILQFTGVSHLSLSFSSLP